MLADMPDRAGKLQTGGNFLRNYHAGLHKLLKEIISSLKALLIKR